MFGAGAYAIFFWSPRMLQDHTGAGAPDLADGQWHHVACSWATSEGTVVVAHFGWMPLFMPLVVVLLLVLGTRLPPQLVRYTPLPSPHPCP